jgi:uncharacterized membrane protein
VDRSGSGKVPFVSGWIVVGLLLASTAMFIALIRRISLLRVNSMLIFTGNQGRKVIAETYPASGPSIAASEVDAVRSMTRTQTLRHRGQPYSLQAIDVASLVGVARSSGGIIEMLVAVGDTVVEMTPLLRILGATQAADEQQLSDALKLGDERTFEQDPKYAIRLLVDIAIKALSPAINDPTTAVQALDQIEDLLLRLGQRHLEVGAFHDQEGKLRLLVPYPAWEDLLGLAFDEIAFCGATSVQVMRRMNALVSGLKQSLPEARHPALQYWDARLKSLIARTFADLEERTEASRSDRQGLGATRQEPPE